jgi:phosphatidylserine/phosphatidylglycerophosphate/cardiolipin synthase-like enzyme
MTSKKAKNCPDFRCETCEDGRISSVSRLNQNNFLSFFFCHTFMQRSLIFALVFLLISNAAYSKNISTGSININTATAYQLTLLPGIGKATAKKIIISREKNPILNKIDLLTRRLIRSNYWENLEPLISYTGNHQYDDPNKKRKASSSNKSNQKKKYHSSNWGKNFAINKAIQIDNAEKIVLLTDGSFFVHLSNALNQAKKEIWLSTFVFKTTQNKHNKAVQIVEILKRKAKQGIDVKLVLEQSEYHHDLSEGNHRLANHLRQHKIKVFFDSMDNTMHSKIVVIDGKQVFLGSHNMTDSALRRNHEASLMIISSQLSKELIHYFESIAKE